RCARRTGSARPHAVARGADRGGARGKGRHAGRAAARARQRARLGRSSARTQRVEARCGGRPRDACRRASSVGPMTVVARDLETRLARARSDVREDRVLELLALLMKRASPPRRERALAEDVANWGARAGGDVAWEVDPLDDASANLVGRSVMGDARELAM